MAERSRVCPSLQHGAGGACLKSHARHDAVRLSQGAVAGCLFYAVFAIMAMIGCKSPIPLPKAALAAVWFAVLAGAAGGGGAPSSIFGAAAWWLLPKAFYHTVRDRGVLASEL